MFYYGRSIAFYNQVAVYKYLAVKAAFKVIAKVVVKFCQLFYFALVLVVYCLQLFVNGLQLFVGALHLFVAGYQFFVVGLGMVAKALYYFIGGV